MCWISKFPPKEQIAEKDIEVEKVLLVIGNNLHSPVCPKVWKKGEVEIEPVNFNNIEPDSIFKDYRINKGFHSAKSLDHYSNNLDFFFFLNTMKAGIHSLLKEIIYYSQEEIMRKYLKL